MRHAIGPDGVVEVRVRHGDIRVHGVAGDSVVLRARDDELDRLHIERGEGSLSVRAADGRTPDLDLGIPAGAGVIIEAANADIDVEALSGDQRYRTASGDVDLRGVRGRISVEAMSGDVDLIADGPTRLDLRTVSGDLAIRAGLIESLHAATTSGDVRVAGRFVADGRHSIETVSGDITLAPANDVRVELRTITGDIRSDRPSRLEEAAGRRTLVVGQGGTTIAVRSTSGDLRVVPAATLQPEESMSTSRMTTDPSPSEVEQPHPDGDADLEILRALERGEIDLDEARRRLASLEDGVPDHPSDTPTTPPDPEEAPDA